MDIILYNEHQHGDLILGRENIRWIVNHSPKNLNFYYLHNKHPESIFVHDRIRHISATFKFHAVPMVNMEKYFKNDEKFKNTLWVSTWLGSIKNVRKLIDNKGWERYLLPNEKNTYVIDENPDLWDTMETQLMLCKQNIDTINEALLLNFNSYKIPYPNGTEDMLVKWNGSPKYKDKINSILYDSYKLKVLICNGNTESNQRQNIDYYKYLKDIIKENQDVLFYFTDNVNSEFKNIVNINEIIPVPNLNEIEYLSKFCDIIVTSLSGPGCSVINDAVVKDPNKTLIYVCRSIIGLVYNNHLCKCIQTEDYSQNNIRTLIKDAILEKK